MSILQTGYKILCITTLLNAATTNLLSWKGFIKILCPFFDDYSAEMMSVVIPSDSSDSC